MDEVNSKRSYKNSILIKLIASAVCIALGYVLPFLTGGIPQVGNMLCPMHIPVILCGFICGGPWGAVVGFIVPLLRSLTLSAPPLYPTAVGMMFELAAYGFLSGLLYKLFPKKLPYIYLSLILAMIGGRAVLGAANVVLYSFGETAYSWALFMSGAFINAIPGIILQIVIIPPAVFALKRSRILKD